MGPERIWVATSGKDIVGLVSLIQDDEQAEVEPIVVSTQHRGQGIGQELLNHAIEEARRLGVLCLSVKPVARNEEAIFQGIGTYSAIHVAWTILARAMETRPRAFW